MNTPLFIVVDLFCGFGGTTRGFEMVENGMAKVIACVNHDPKAIKSHWLNHPDVVHFEEDIRTLELSGLVDIVEHNRKLYPHALLILWASLECTNHSKAKGGMSRDADSRTLAEDLDRYINALTPDYIQIENVVEFKDWGPLMIKEVVDENGYASCPIVYSKKNCSFTPVYIPDPKRKGEDFKRWCAEVDSLGYYNEWCELNSANFGAYTSRNRLFGCFAKPHLPIVWPEPTHAKKVDRSNLFQSNLKSWKAVREVLDFSDEGESIFIRKKPLSDKTFERINAGLVKFVANGDTTFLSKYYSGHPESKNISIGSPAHSLTTKDHHSLVTTSFIQQRNTGRASSRVIPVEQPARTITATGGNQDLVQTKFISTYYGNGFNRGVSSPAPTVTTKDRLSLIQPRFLDMQYGNGTPSDIHKPAPTITTNPKHQIVSCKSWLLNPQYNSRGSSIDNPCFTLIARMDKAAPYIISAEVKSEKQLPSFIKIAGNTITYEIYKTDSEVMMSIKKLMAAYGIVDIKMRMLRIPELLRIQGFPDSYKMFGTQADQKKFIGNSVVPLIPKAWAEALAYKIVELRKAS